MKNKSVICVIILIVILSILTLMFTCFELNKSGTKQFFENEESEINFESSSDLDVTPDIKEDKFKNINNFEELDNYLKRENISILVLGKTGCNFCDLYKPILEEVSGEYGLEILYIDFKQFDEEEYEKVMDSEITIPKKCTNYDEDVPLKRGFGTPLTLFIKENTSYDCIRGYKQKDVLISELRRLDLID